ncbi:hypothetical protein HK103_006027 [Boothiomyces macroporosus]|uniref:Uncharacterized protein n=1 Tax=Boothiomyces macroporosus TaxID=261099 RepID=A0AAD5YAU4_9FUNG|nr:hypothetical protein HK103_006027 [Boothiomyces macroporosus]
MGNKNQRAAETGGGRKADLVRFSFVDIDVKEYLETECEKAVNEINRLTKILDRMADELGENKKASFAMKTQLESRTKFDDQSQANYYLSERLKECQNELLVQQRENKNLVYTAKELKANIESLENYKTRFIELSRESEIDKKYILQLESQLQILNGQKRSSEQNSRRASSRTSQQDILNIYPEKAVSKPVVDTRFHAQKESQTYKDLHPSDSKDSKGHVVENMANLHLSHRLSQKVEQKELYKIVQSENYGSEKLLDTTDVEKNRRESLQRTFIEDPAKATAAQPPSKQRLNSPPKSSRLLSPTPVHSSHIQLGETNPEKQKYHSVSDQVNHPTISRENSISSTKSDTPTRKRSISQIPIHKKSPSSSKTSLRKISVGQYEQPTFIKNEVLKSQTMLNELDSQIKGLADMKT